MPGVMMLVNEFPPLPVGGAERQAERLSGYLASHGWPVSVLTRSAPGLPGMETREGYRIIRPATFGPGKFRTLSFVLGALWVLLRERKQYQILHAHLAFGPAFAALLAARLLGKRVIVKLGNSGQYGDIQVSQKTWRGRLRLSLLRRWANMVIVLDETMQKEALQAGFRAERMRFVRNGIDTRRYAQQPDRAGLKARLGLGGKLVVISVGRLAAQKSLDVLLDAFASALKQRPDLQLLLVGDGPERPALEARARALEINKRVKFAGNQADVLPYLGAADIFALPSSSEGISNSLLEAMASGLACVASPVGGSPEALDGGRCGRLVPVGDAQAWSQALVELAESAELRKQLGSAARERVVSDYDFQVTGARYETLYAGLLDIPQPPASKYVEVKR